MDTDQLFEEAIGNYFGNAKQSIRVNEKTDLQNIKMKVKDDVAQTELLEKRKVEVGVSEDIVADKPKKRARKSQSILLESGYHDFLPKGWKKEVLQRTTGQTAGKIDVFFFSPSGKRLRSKVEIMDYSAKNNLGLDIENFSFTRTKKKNPDGTATFVGLNDMSNSNDTQHSNDSSNDSILKSSNFRDHDSKNDKENGQSMSPEHYIAFDNENDPSADFPFELTEKSTGSVLKIEKHLSFSCF